jgi:acetyl-CoA C-acetyltransferase
MPEPKSRPAMVGWGHTKFGKLDGETIESLITSAARDAITNSGIPAEDIDAVWLGQYNSGLVADSFCSSMVLAADSALRFKPAARLENACASGAAAIYAALDAIESGRIRTALVVGAEKMTGLDTAGVTRALSGAAYQAEEASLTFPDIFARFARCYAERFGDPTEAMARIAVKNHRNALANPLAHLRKPLDLEFCRTPSERNPIISPPLKLTDCSLVSDGAAAVVLTNGDVALDLPRAVSFKATAQVNDLLPLSAKDLSVLEGPRRAISLAMDRAGLTIGEIDVAEVHDCFTIAELMVMEAMGLAPPGGGGALLADGYTDRSGPLPINVSGGLKAKGHPIGATGVSMHVMVARQLLGEAGEMQLRSPEYGLCFNMGGGAVANYASILMRL